MKPHRIRMTHSLIMNYGLYKKMEIYVGGAPYNSILDLLTAFTESETCDESRDVSIPHR